MQRRICLMSGLSMMVSACEMHADGWRPPEPLPPLTEEEKQLAFKFRKMGGGELLVDAFGEKHGVYVTDEYENRFFSRGMVSPRNSSISAYMTRFGVPKTLRAIWHENTPNLRMTMETNWEGSRIIASYTVPVAWRIPDEVLDAVRAKKGGFRLKLRLHDDGLLIGWDINKGRSVYTGMTEFGMAGGDFQEAEIVNGKAVRKGWYIHPKTKERVETDF
jgi:hypothetical protein